MLRYEDTDRRSLMRKVWVLFWLGMLFGVFCSMLPGCTGYSKLQVLDWEASTGGAPTGWSSLDGPTFGWWEQGGGK